MDICHCFNKQKHRDSFVIPGEPPHRPSPSPPANCELINQNTGLFDLYAEPKKVRSDWRQLIVAGRLELLDVKREARIKPADRDS